MSGKNSYAQKAQKKQILSGIATAASDKSLPTTERLKKTVAPALLNTAVALGGGFAGAAMGRLSLLGGLIIAGAGEYLGSAATTSFGLGMAVSNVTSLASGVNGTEDKTFMEEAKERIKTYGKGLMEKLYLDKIIKKEETNTDNTSGSAQTTNQRTRGANGMGEVNYFSYPLKENPDPIDLSELERYEKMVEASAESFAKENSVSGLEKVQETEKQESSSEDRSTLNELNGFYSDDKIL